MEQILRNSPSARAIDNWVDELAAVQASNIAQDLIKAHRACASSDAAPGGAECTAALTWDESDTTDSPDGTIKTHNLGIEKAGKTCNQSAKGTKGSFRRVEFVRRSHDDDVLLLIAMMIKSKGDNRQQSSE